MDVDDDQAAFIKELPDSDEEIIQKFAIVPKRVVCLSGTPFRSIKRGEFTDENTFTYSYFDEQRNKYPG